MSDKDDPVPSPEEIGRKLSDFMKSHFGDAVTFTQMPPQADLRTVEEDDGGEPVPVKEGNDIFHFKRDLSLGDYETLTTLRDWVLIKAQTAEATNSKD